MAKEVEVKEVAAKEILNEVYMNVTGSILVCSVGQVKNREMFKLNANEAKVLLERGYITKVEMPK